MVRQAPIDQMNPSDLEYANLLFEYLAQLYRVFAKLFYPKANQGASQEQYKQFIAHEKELLREMTLFARVLETLDKSVTETGEDWKLSECLISQFADMAWQYGQHCTRKNNVILNRAEVHCVLGIGQRPDWKAQLKKKCREVAVFLKSR
jgi:hypothetical protein